MEIITVSTNDKSVKLFEISQIITYDVARANIFYCPERITEVKPDQNNNTCELSKAMYTRYYGLTRKPFENTPDPLFLFQSKSHREVLASLIYGIDSAKGLIVVVGDIGTGKTTLIHALLEELDPSQVILKITNPRLFFAKSTIGNILEYFVRELGISLDKTDSREMVETLTRELEALDKEGRRAVLIIDEAHLLSEDSLQDIRLLSNIENEKKKLIQIVLMGQNELQHKLQEESLRSFKQRISISRRLMPLGKTETEEYVTHRFRIAGRKTSLFERRALSLIFTESQGIPRLINHICDSSLVIGYAIQTNSIGAGIVKEVINDMNSIYGYKKTESTLFFHKLSRTVLYTFLAVVVALGLFYYIAVKPAGILSRQNENGLISAPREPSTRVHEIPRYPVKDARHPEQFDSEPKGLEREEAGLETKKDESEKESLYTVQEGDTLFKIAGNKDVYGDPLKWPSLFRLNLDALNGMPITDDLEQKDLAEGLHLRFLTQHEASQNLAKLSQRIWVVNVLSAHNSDEIVPLAVNLMRNGYHVYVTKADVQGKKWLRLRVGFFRNSSEANSAKDEISSRFYLDNLWITRAKNELREFGGY